MRGRGIPVGAGAALFAALMVCAPLRAETDVPGVFNVRFRNYGVDEGMSQSTAMQMAQDKTGFVWIGTQDGLDRFDGYGFKIYKHARGDAHSLSDNHVRTLAADRDGALWIGTQAGGLNRYDPTLDRFDAYLADPAKNNALADNLVTALMLDRRGWLWVASAGGKLQWFDRTTRAFLDTPLGTRAALTGVRRMVEQADGSVLLGTRAGLWVCDADAATMRELHLDPAQSLDVQALTISPNGEIWASATGAGVFRLAADGHILARYRSAGSEHLLPDDDVRDMKFDGAGRLWLSTNTGGLLRLDPAADRARQYQHDPTDRRSLAGNRQQSVLIDRDGLIWAGSWNDGVSVHDPRSEAFASVRTVAGDPRTLPARPLPAMWRDADDTLWFGMAERGGLVHFDPNAGVLARFATGSGPCVLPPNVIEWVVRTRDRSLWIATAGGGLQRLPDGATKFVAYRRDRNDPDSIASDDVLSLLEDRSGTLWVGTVDAGLDELCAGCTQFRHHRHDAKRPDSIGDGPIARIFEGGDGALWLALRPGGLDRYDRSADRFGHFRANAQDPASLSNDAITTIMQDSRGGLWIGTQGGGLDHLLPASAAPRFENISTVDGLAADAIGCVVEDAAHTLWISTTVGVSRYDPVARHVTNFGAQAGAFAQGYFLNSCAQLSDGRIVFGGPAGATIIDTAAVQPLPPPRPVLLDVLLDNQPAPLRWRDETSPLQDAPWNGGQAVFSHRQTNVGFEFSALDFADPEAIEYAYRLDGHDAGWIPASAARRYAPYTNLAAGDYTLRVRARRYGSSWNDAEAKLQIRVLPLPWLSPLALFGYGAAVLSIGGWIGWRTRADLKRQRLAQRAVRASAERLKLALWGNGGEMWDINMQDGTFVQENRIPGLAVGGANGPRTVHEYRKYIHPDDLAGFEQARTAHLKGRADFFEATYRTPDLGGEWRWLLTRGRVVERDANGRALRLVGTTQDISVLKRTEESLRKLNEELESRVELRTTDLRRANEELLRTLDELKAMQRQLLESEKMAALGGLVAGVAHEINTPLGVTVTAASHLQDKARRIGELAAANALTAEAVEEFQIAAEESSQIILRNLNRADRLIRSFKQVAVDQSSEERRTIELGAYLNEILISLGPALKKTPHRVHVDCAEPVSLDTFPGAIYQIVSNLLMNSVHHAFAPGQTGDIVIAVKKNGQEVELSCRDNGRGMDEPVRARIFEPFFTTRRGEGGSGLGLHVVYNLVTQLLGGKIHVTSAPGAGATFEIVLPLS
jgi:signal transduction histidine kinase/ligand-binding sensor domain-containing protein